MKSRKSGSGSVRREDALLRLGDAVKYTKVVGLGVTLSGIQRVKGKRKRKSLK